MPDLAPTVAVIGGGQLARMLAEPAAALGIPLRLLAEAEGVSAAQVIPDTIVGDYRDLEMLRKVTSGAQVVTFDHEHVPTEHLHALAEAGVAVRPGPGGARPRPGQGGDAGAAHRAGGAVPAARRRDVGGGRRGVRAAVRAQGHPWRVRRPRGVDGPRPRRGARRRSRPRRRPASGCSPRSSSTSVASWPRWWPGRRVARRRRTPSSPAPSSTASATRWSRPAPDLDPELATRAQQVALDDRQGARRRRDPRGRAVRDPRRAGAGQRARDAAPQHRPLDPGRCGHQPVREPPARGPGPAARAPRRRGRRGR